MAPSGTFALTGAAMLAFAANSLLCRAALERELIDAASFGAIRLVSGAAVLVALATNRGSASARARADWPAAVMLFGYVALFSFAYRGLSAGMGALILFGAVQATMFVAGLRAGERFPAIAWCGFALALGGLVYLVSPGIESPAPIAATSMAGAGVAWGVYSLRGRHAGDALATSAGNFARAAPLALLLTALTWRGVHAEVSGVALAIASGALTSGLGYVVWYAALKRLSAMRAASVQLSVPPLAALGGAAWLGEVPGIRLVVASAAILGGIALVLASRASNLPRVAGSRSVGSSGPGSTAAAPRCEDRQAMDASRRLYIRGRVQGVGFRASLRSEAARRGLSGWVRNRRDGSVEAVVRGERSAVDELIAWARRGPPAAYVECVDVRDESGAEVGAAGVFELRPTH